MTMQSHAGYRQLIITNLLSRIGVLLANVINSKVRILRTRHQTT